MLEIKKVADWATHKQTHADELQSHQTNESFVIQLEHIRFVF
ncbi:hypothetical protein [Lactobacillus amylovorus]|nr:hypothetical protein [Lactobacillus amylovorus]